MLLFIIGKLEKVYIIKVDRRQGILEVGSGMGIGGIEKG